jgi:hypothetical protein
MVEPATTTSRELPQRLCSEIQLFDLCELEQCNFKEGRFCTDPELLAKFEAEDEPEEQSKWHFDQNGDDDQTAFFDEEESEYSLFDGEEGYEDSDDEGDGW